MVKVFPPPCNLIHPTLDPDPKYYTLETGTEICRIFNPQRHNTKALTFRNFGPNSRFHHHRDYNCQPKNDLERSIYYCALDLSCCLVEFFGDRKVIGITTELIALPIVISPITLLDLRDCGAMRAGAVGAISAMVERNLSQQWSRYFYEQTDIYSSIDGLLYYNAHNYEEAIALYQRAKDKLKCPQENIIDLKDPDLKDYIQMVADDNNMVFDQIS